ncbi:glycosyltransferase [Caballeronia sp. BR00000012568055]|uniref:glycosyltransferase n=1 Tax=Caballeronia sp. BR00000012568055 TaxID=2918761 RepID=UPI0023F97100|nr:glycosyltransferase [Caballeronia sp. BR00000012568055]
MSDNSGCTASRPMNIGMLTHIKHPIREPFAGGLEAFTYDMTQMLRKRGHTVTLFAHPESSPELDVRPMSLNRHYRQESRRHDHDTLSTEFIAEHHAYMDCLQRIDDCGFDVVFNNSLHYVPITFSGSMRTPMLTVLHTPPFFELINAVAAQHERGGGHYCTVSATNAASWADLIPTCHVIPNGIDLQFWRPANAANEQHAIWYGRLVADKGPHLAIDAARAAGMALRIAGQATDASYFSEFIQPRLGGDIEYLGHLPRARLVDELGRAAVCLVTPRWDEPFGLVVAEALACGTPVAAFSRGAIPELLTADTGIMVPADDVSALAEAILAARALDRRACRLHAEAKWSMDRMIAGYESLLSGLCPELEVEHE